MTVNSDPIGLVVAMDAELVHTLNRYSRSHSDVRGNWTFHHFEIDGHPIVALRCGMGLINAAAGTERLIAEFGPEIVLNYGCSGAHRREIMPGDLVIGERVVHHSAMQILKDGTERYAGFGYDVAGERMDAAELSSDPALIELATSLQQIAVVESWPGDLFWPKTVDRRAPTVHSGVVASADIWTQATDRIDTLHSRHQSLCEDMEAAAIAQVCALHGTRFLTVKDISNNEFLQASDLEGFSDFPVAEIGKRAGKFMWDLIAHLPS